MSQAKKYFTVPRKNYDAKKTISESKAQEEKNVSSSGANGKSLDGLVDKVIEQVRRNITDKAYENGGSSIFDYKNSRQTGNNSGENYKAPLPEKVVPEKNQDLDELVNKAGKKSKSLQEEGAKPPVMPNPLKNSANPVEYVAGEVLQNVREGIVQNPLDPAYQLARKVGNKLVMEPANGFDIILHETLILGIYALIDSLFRKKP